MDTPLLHLVFGGEVADPSGTDFVDADDLDVVGIFPSYAAAMTAWQGVSRAKVDHAHIKYVIVHLHRMLDPDHPAEDFHERGSDREG
ncbi:MAG: DUF4170 domain-containing protein [Rhodospirillales bacterium]|nr:DUF4170 domain-containing protein [Rhodospirillales bacterium]